MQKKLKKTCSIYGKNVLIPKPGNLFRAPLLRALINKFSPTPWSAYRGVKNHIKENVGCTMLVLLELYRPGRSYSKGKYLSSTY